MRSFVHWGVFLLCLCCLLRPVRADVKAASLFTDNMVLQQGITVRVWGTAAPNEAVTVTFGAQSVQATAGADGKWQVRLQPLQASETPQTLSITGKNTLNFKNVLVGEVWVCGGQSNMEWVLANARDGAQEVAAADYPQIRLFSEGSALSPIPLETCRGTWQVCSPATAGKFSAVGYFFGRELWQRLHVPVGLINASVGGTRAEPWTSLPGFKVLPSFKAQAEAFEQVLKLYQADPAEYKRQKELEVNEYPARRAAWYQQLDAREPGFKGKWMAPEYDASHWRTVQLPGDYGKNPMGCYLGSLWCRKDVEIPASWVGKALELHVGAVDEVDDTYVNGTHVGRIWFETRDFWKVPRVYPVPADVVTSRKVSIVVRMVNQHGDVGLFGPAEEMKLVLPGASDEQPVPLTGAWRYTEGLLIIGKEVPRLPGTNPPGFSGAEPAGLFNGMIAPLTPFAIRGVIWYQGESNANEPDEYYELFAGLIASWRAAWGQGDFPFAFVQLANFLTPQSLPVEKGSWAELREMQVKALGLRNTTMATIIDLGEPWNIHPLNKQDVGKRLALGVLAKTYSQNIPLYSGPLYKSMKVQGKTIRVRFTFADGLNAKDGKLPGFAIAGRDKVFHPAQARIDGETVVVWSDRVPKPTDVRYGWGNNPTVTLYNAANLPASPFRTDKWEPKDITVEVE